MGPLVGTVLGAVETEGWKEVVGAIDGVDEGVSEGPSEGAMVGDDVGAVVGRGNGVGAEVSPGRSMTSSAPGRSSRSRRWSPRVCEAVHKAASASERNQWGILQLGGLILNNANGAAPKLPMLHQPRKSGGNQPWGLQIQVDRHQ